MLQIFVLAVQGSCLQRVGRMLATQSNTLIQSERKAGFTDVHEFLAGPGFASLTIVWQQRRR